MVASDQSSTGSTVESTSRGVKSAPFSSSNQTSQIDDVIQKAASLRYVMTFKQRKDKPIKTGNMKETLSFSNNFSKLQARQAFGMYLQRVKQRLVKEVR